MALEKKYYSGAQVFDIIKELPCKEFLSLLDTFAKERGSDAVEVVRCKDCVLRWTACPMVVRWTDGYGVVRVSFFTTDDDFCSRGKK